MKNIPALKAPDAIRVTGLSIGYRNELVVAGINFQILRGQSLALVGTNGSGKSTLLKTLVGLIPPSRGELEVLGTVPGKFAANIAYLSQFHAPGFILPLRAIDVVRMGRFADHGLLGKMTSEDDVLVRQAMERMGVWQLADQPLRSLSGGQIQRVYIAQVLARRADLLILDEPTAGVDAGGKEIYQNVIQEELNRGASVVVATHDIREAMRCDYAMLLARKVVAYGHGRDIFTKETLMDAFGAMVAIHTSV